MAGDARQKPWQVPLSYVSGLSTSLTPTWTLLSHCQTSSSLYVLQVGIRPPLSSNCMPPSPVAPLPLPLTPCIPLSVSPASPSPETSLALLPPSHTTHHPLQLLQGPEDYVKLNSGQVGLYTVNYAPQLWDRLVEAAILKTGEGEAKPLSPSDLAGLISDSYHHATHGETNITIYLRLLSVRVASPPSLTSSAPPFVFLPPCPPMQRPLIK